MSRSSRRTVALLVAEQLEPRRLLSDVVPVGSEFRVNTYTSSSQLEPVVAMDADGDFVTAWQSSFQDGDNGGIYAQRYDAAGDPLGPEFRVNTVTAFDQTRPAIAMDANGSFVVAWDNSSLQGDSEVHAQRFNAAGVPQGGEFRVNTYTANSQGDAAVAMDADGDFVIAWHSQNQGEYGFAVYAQRFNAAGVPQGVEFRANTFNLFDQALQTAAMDADGDFVIAWASGSQTSLGETSLHAQRYDAAGLAQGGEFRVNTHTLKRWPDPEVAMDTDGDFVVAWESYGQDGEGDGIYARRYDAAGAAHGDEFRVNSYTTASQSSPAVDVTAAGDVVVAWQSFQQDGSNWGIYAQRYDAAGVAQGGEFRVNTYTNSRQMSPDIALDVDGDFVVAWHSLRGAEPYETYAQRYGVVPTVSAASFNFATAPHRLSFTFDRDVSAGLGIDDLAAQNLTTMQTMPAADFALSYDAATNVATFAYTGTTAGIAGMLPDGRYTATLLAAGIKTVQGAPLVADVALSFRFLQADANNDGRVNLDDFNVLAANFGQSPRDFTQGDFDYSGTVNLADFNVLASRFGQVLAAPAAGESSSADGSRRRDAWLDELLA